MKEKKQVGSFILLGFHSKQWQNISTKFIAGNGCVCQLVLWLLFWLKIMKTDNNGNKEYCSITILDGILRSSTHIVPTVWVNKSQRYLYSVLTILLLSYNLCFLLFRVLYCVFMLYIENRDVSTCSLLLNFLNKWWEKKRADLSFYSSDVTAKSLNNTKSPARHDV